MCPHGQARERSYYSGGIRVSWESRTALGRLWVPRAEPGSHILGSVASLLGSISFNRYLLLVVQ